jgi:hypothetical protein
MALIYLSVTLVSDAQGARHKGSYAGRMKPQDRSMGCRNQPMPLRRWVGDEQEEPLTRRLYWCC